MKKNSFKIISIFLCILLILQQTGLAQVASVELNLTSRFTSAGNALANTFFPDRFRPLHLRYLSYDQFNNNFKLLLDKGDANNLKTQEIKSTTQDLLNYFLVGVALPNDTFWVNLRPDSPNDIIDPLLAQTQIGKIFLEADLQLKKDTANATNPQTPEGKEYWNKLYQKAGQLYGNQNVTIPTLTRPWIIPDEIIIRESTDSAYVHKATLKVMLEQDYLKGNATYSFKDPREKELNEYSSQIMREDIIPKLTKEINNAKRYAPLRQVYYSLILAQWFKARHKGLSLKTEGGRAGLNLPYTSLINSKNLFNLQAQTPYSVATYFNAYKENFTKGEYNLQEPTYTPYGQVIRSYFSGGMVVNLVIPETGAVSSSGPVTVVPVVNDPSVSNNNISIKVSDDGVPVMTPGSFMGSAGQASTGQMKPLGLRDPLDEDVNSGLNIRHGEFESIAQSRPDENVYGLAARVVVADLGNIGAYHFYSPTLGGIIVVNSRYDSQVQEEGKFHEVREIYWTKKGFTQHEAHVIASAEQVQVRKDKFTSYHRQQLAYMSADDLGSIINEVDRRGHHEILIRAKNMGAGIDIKAVKRYEENLRQEAKKLLDRQSNPNLSGRQTEASRAVFTNNSAGEDIADIQGAEPLWTGFGFVEYLREIQKQSKRKFNRIGLYQLGRCLGEIESNAIKFSKKNISSTGRLYRGLNSSYVLRYDFIQDGAISEEQWRMIEENLRRYKSEGLKYLKSIKGQDAKREKGFTYLNMGYGFATLGILMDLTSVVLEYNKTDSGLQTTIWVKLDNLFKPAEAGPVNLVDILREAVLANREALRNRGQRTGIKDPLSFEAMFGCCGLASDDLWRRINEYFGAAYAEKVKIRLLQSANIVSTDGFRHAFLVVSYNGIDYLVDTTFIQFFNPLKQKEKQIGYPGFIIKEISRITTKSGEPNNWETLAEELLRNGFIKLTDEVADMYGTALRGKLTKDNKDKLFTKKDFLEGSTRELDYTPEELNKYMGVLSSEPLNPDMKMEKDIQEAVDQGIANINPSQNNPNSLSSSPSTPVPGGIDFRFLPIVTQSMDSLKASIRSMPGNTLQRMNLAQEWSDIERLLNSGITPSAQRLKEYLAASCFKGNFDSDMEKIVSCISDILRMEEQSCCTTDPTLKDILVVLGSGRSAEELKIAFGV